MNRTIHPTSISAQVASHAAQPPTRRSKRRSRKRGPSGSCPTHNPVARTTHAFPTHEESAGAKIDSTQWTIKKPCLKDFKTESENEEEDGGDDEHDKALLENEIEALDCAHKMGVLALLINIFDQLSIIPGTFPRFLNDSMHLETTYSCPAVADEFPAVLDAVNLPRRLLVGSAPFPFPKTNPLPRYGLLSESPGAPFDDEVWKDWTLTPLELRHSLAPKEDKYSEFPHPSPLPSVPCVVRFDIIRHFPCETLCTIGCAHSDISNGWVVTHSKTLLVDDDEAARFISAI
ncbi:hypothetical protein BDN71DRAFT_1503454 [Pleurotus eryngii]|uniref:Uncharacterized protein n=1 Tax=Pleurotus eryngii TaxID=5323 RepID=A0A9P6A3S2_PLEER|nr:hypothetical protein BDN71DRAFT_1503454 [Pleurotus eryngii]